MLLLLQWILLRWQLLWLRRWFGVPLTITLLLLYYYFTITLLLPLLYYYYYYLLLLLITICYYYNYYYCYRWLGVPLLRDQVLLPNRNTALVLRYPRGPLLPAWLRNLLLWLQVPRMQPLHEGWTSLLLLSSFLHPSSQRQGYSDYFFPISLLLRLVLFLLRFLLRFPLRFLELIIFTIPLFVGSLDSGRLWPGLSPWLWMLRQNFHPKRRRGVCYLQISGGTPFWFPAG